MRLFWPESIEWEKTIEKLQEQEVLNSFHPDVLSFVQELSKKLLRIRQYPELVSLGYWLRKTNMNKMQQSWNDRTNDQFVRARGTVFHLAPSNVDTIFVYSWMLSLLAGNRNIIRISSKEQPQTKQLLSTMIEILKEPKYTTVAKRTVLLTYQHNENLTGYFSENCHTRVVWGGDRTIKAIRQIPLAPLANELVFPDRFSLALIHAHAFLKTNEEEKKHLLQQFYNDSFWFDQMACSSPRLLYWIGDRHIIESAQEEFWTSFEQVIREKEYELVAATQVQKLATSLWLASEQEVKGMKNSPYFSRVTFEKMPVEVRERHCGGGLFYESTASSLLDVLAVISDKDQTLSYFGFSKEELIEFASKVQARGIDRIVPIGQALNFDGVWDGQSFLQSFTREVVII